MTFILFTFLKRISREKFKSLVVPLLALVLVMLISIMGSIGTQLTNDLEYVIENFEVRVELSNPVTSETEYLNIDNHFIEMFTNPEVDPTLTHFLKDVELKRSLNITDEDIVGQLVGITSIEADRRLDLQSGVFFDFFDGYDENILRTEEFVGVVNSDIFNMLDPDNPVIAISVQSRAVDFSNPFIVHPIVETELIVVGISHGAGRNIYAPFWTVANLGMASDGNPTYSDVMKALMSDNTQIGEFSIAAQGHFARGGDAGTALPHSLTVFDSIYNDVTHRLRQNIQLISIASPFIYLISVLIGFIASFLLTRRRKPEFAIMRSVGINKRDVFWGALAEQVVLCAAGAVVGYLVFWAISGDALWTIPLLFTACYALGAALSVQKATGANVLKILRDKE